MIRSILLASLVILAVGASTWAGETAPKTILVPGEQYLAMRQALRTTSEPWLIKTREQLTRDAEFSLTQGPWSVMDKGEHLIGPSGDKHDFVSFSDYWWRKPDGTWDFRDGQRNPAMAASDVVGLNKLYTHVQVLGTAGYMLDEPKYHERAAKILRAWFLDPATRMNPNLNYAAGIPGRKEGRSFGLLRLKKMPEVLDMIGLLRATGAWTDTDERAMQQWTRQYLDWATKSEFGVNERNAVNNHGVFYAYQIVACALYVGDTAIAADLLGEHFRTKLLGQVAADGSIPQELKRTKPKGYTLFNLTALMLLAEVGRSAGVDLYAVKGDAGQSIDTAATATLTYLKGERQFPPAQEPDLKLSEVLPALRLTARRLNDPFAEKYLREQFKDWEKDYHNLWWPPK